MSVEAKNKTEEAKNKAEEETDNLRRGEQLPNASFSRQGTLDIIVFVLNCNNAQAYDFAFFFRAQPGPVKLVIVISSDDKYTNEGAKTRALLQSKILQSDNRNNV
uniref:Centromere protein M n=1 Tax=Loa loa TaxID=7209 RepID=A0A1I7V883_LOALO